MSDSNTQSFSLWSDAETEVDLLGFTHLVDAVERLVKTPELLPATVGVFGDWGSGKTSVLKMCAKRLEADEETLVLWFNGWLFEGYDQAKASLMERLVDELVEKRCTSDKMKKLAVRLFRRINWLRVAGTALKTGGAFALGGPPLAAIAGATDFATLAKSAGKEIEDIDEGKLDAYLKESQSESFNRNVTAFRDEFAELLQEAKIERLVVLIDDLDRCLPPTVIQTLEAIKLFLSVGNVAFVIGADERLVQYAVRERFPELPGERVDVGRDYLEKLIQYPVRVPSLSRSEVQSYIALLFLQANGDESALEKVMQWFRSPERSVSAVAFDHDAAIALDVLGSDLVADGMTISSQVGPLLGKGLSGNPRQCKRFLNMLMMRLGMAESRGVPLSRKLLAKLMILEYLKPELFRQLGDMQAEGHGRPEGLVAWQQARAEAAGAEGEMPSAPSGLEVWEKDPVALEWLDIEPALDDADLGPYFYFSRDVLTDHGQQVQRMGAAAREVYRQLLSKSDAVRINGLKDMEKLSLAEASSVLNELFRRARSDESSDTIKLVLDVSEKRSDLLGDVIAFLGSVPEAQVPVWAVSRLHAAAKATEFLPSVKAQCDRWSKSSQGTLAQASKRELERMEGTK